jgi:hypothetical protein
MLFASPGVVSLSHTGYDQQRQHELTSHGNVTSSSPSKKSLSRRNNDDKLTHSARTFSDRLLLRKSHSHVDICECGDALAIVDSKRLNEQQSADDREIYYCGSDEGDCVIRNMKQTADLHLSVGLPKEALHTLNKCLALQQQMHGKVSVEVAETFNMMGTIMAIMGTEYHYRAVAAFEQALEIYQQELGFGSEESAGCRKNLYLLLHQRLGYDVRCTQLPIRSVSMWLNWEYVKDQYGSRR